MLFVDGRCYCSRCETRTHNVYRMVGKCRNCGAEPILVMYRAGDGAGAVTCPVCERYDSVHVSRLATPDEIPVA